MIILSVISVVFLLLVLEIHYNNHFQSHLQKCCIDSTCKCCCIVAGVNDKEFTFFPMSFLLYVIFIILLCLISISHNIMEYIHYNQTNMALLFNYFLTYAMLITSLWEDLLAFFRYYTTAKTMNTLHTISTKAVFKMFSIYIAIFTSLFIIQIHFYYWIFPIIICLTFGFNLWCNLKFFSIVITKYETCEQECEKLKEHHFNVVKILQFLRIISLICCLVHTMSFGLFISIISINTKILIIYLPILWIIFCTMYTLNFSRNRTWLRQNKCIKIVYSCCNKIKNNPAQQHNPERIQTEASKSEQESTDEIKSPDIPEDILLDALTSNTLLREQNIKDKSDDECIELNSNKNKRKKPIICLPQSAPIYNTAYSSWEFERGIGRTLKQTLRSLETLVSYGFCDIKDIVGIDELKIHTLQENVTV
eukprot:276692_1